MCVHGKAFSPSRLLVASLIGTLTIWKQLVLDGRMPSALYEAAWEEIVVLHTQEGWTQGGAVRVGGLFGEDYGL